MSQARDASTERLKNLVASFKGDTVKAVHAELSQHGPENCQINLSDGIKKDGTPDRFIQVENHVTRECGEWHNVVHTCPPDCGNGG